MRLNDTLRDQYLTLLRSTYFKALDNFTQIDVGFLEFPNFNLSEFSQKIVNNDLICQNLFDENLSSVNETNLTSCNFNPSIKVVKENQQSLDFTSLLQHQNPSSLKPEHLCIADTKPKPPEKKTDQIVVKTSTSLDLFEQLKNSSTNSEDNLAYHPTRIKSSLYLQTFYTDFNLILSYCLDPLQHPLTSYQNKINKYSFAVLQLIDKHRLHELRKEQKIKKILNLSFKILIRNFVSEKFPEISHISELIKKEFCRYYFLQVSQEQSLFTKPDYRCKKTKNESRPLNLTYNSKFFDTIQRCPRFLNNLIETLDSLELMVVNTVRTDVRRILKRIELCVFSTMEGEVPIQTLEQFFSKRNQLGNKLGIKIPWTRQQITESIELVKHLITAPNKFIPTADDK